MSLSDKDTRPKFVSGSVESIRLGSRVTFTDQTVSFENGEIEASNFTLNHDPNRGGWESKTQFFMGIVSYAVGLGNVWRFPYLLQKNGGGAFLIPYLIMMLLGGMPLFLIELAIGQRLQTGPVGVWSQIHPYLGGLGVSSAIVSYLVSLYYNVIVTWCIYYLFRSFSYPELPWKHCPTQNGTVVPECANQSATSYFWNHEALQTTSSIDDFGGFNWRMLIALFAAWTLVFLCVKRGIKSSGNIMYLTAIFPYVVTFLFLVRSITLDGALRGITHMLYPDLDKLYNPTVWLEAATQIFYSMGLGFGGLIAFGSYLKPDNDCKRDVLLLSGANVGTSLYTAVNVFSVLGFMAKQKMDECIEGDLRLITKVYPQYFPTFVDARNFFTDEAWLNLIDHKFESNYSRMAPVSAMCNYHKHISEAAEGTGLAFVVFTEAILQFPFSQLWSVLFFLMLLALGLGSMFGTLEGVITSLNDSKLISASKPVVTFVLCASAFIIGIPFASRSGQYWVSLFDSFAGSYALMCVAFFEVVSIAYVYGEKRFSDDIEIMTGSRPGIYWRWTWKYFAPSIMGLLFVSSVAQLFMSPVSYIAYNPVTAHQENRGYPTWANALAITMVLAAIAPTLCICFLRYFKILKVEVDIPTATRMLNTTQSTAQFLKSDTSISRAGESLASVAETQPFTATPELTVPSRR